MKPEGRCTIMGGDDYLFGFQSRASFCASAICAEVMRFSVTSRFFAAS